ncbi:MAG: asparagine synthase (glutamine-hydrolyzing) [Rubrivivax sp.]|nr:asparagine synthase (glutamine-hydrolyzing) [Rubrivivax sp.]
MCGIAGLFHHRSGRAPARDELKRLLGGVAHRGPDGQGLWQAAAVGLVHARLSLVDLAGGAQPLANEDGSLQLVCNGEIYNHHELRRDLRARGHVFRTASDSEVLVHLYEECGDALVDALDGPFALALWDARRQRLLLARDRVGMRPLVWTETADGLAFASEAKALLALPGQLRRLDALALAQCWAGWAPLEPRTVFEGIHSLPPGHTLSIEADGRRRLHRYWDWTFDVEPALAAQPTATLAEELRERLQASVRLQLQADVPVGVYLSGGLDSSALAALMPPDAHGADEPPRQAFSLRFEDAAFDEGAAQQQAARSLGAKHHSLLCTRADIAAAFRRAVWHAELPLLRSAPAPLMLLAQRVRECGIKAVLSGEGADELFAGYDLFKEAQVRRFIARQPHSLQRRRLLQRLHPHLQHSPVARGALGGAALLAGPHAPGEALFAHGPRLRAGLRALSLWRPEHLAGIDPPALEADFGAQLPPGSERWPALSRDQYLEAHTLLSGYLLGAQGDRMAMAHGVELRHPFLDHRLIEWAGRLPPRLKLNGLREKFLLREAMRGRLPEAVRGRVKQPYRAPDAASFFNARGEPADIVRECLSAEALTEAGWFEPARVARLVDKCAAGRAIGFADNMALLGVLSVQCLHRDLIAAPPVFDSRGGASHLGS